MFGLVWLMAGARMRSEHVTAESRMKEVTAGIVTESRMIEGRGQRGAWACRMGRGRAGSLAR